MPKRRLELVMVAPTSSLSQLWRLCAGLTTLDLIGKRRDLLAKNLLEVAIAATAKGYYSEVEIVDQGNLEMEMKVAATKAKKTSATTTPQEQLENKS